VAIKYLQTYFWCLCIRSSLCFMAQTKLCQTRTVCVCFWMTPSHQLW